MESSLASWLCRADDIVVRLNDEAVIGAEDEVGDDEVDIDDDAMIGGYLASQLGDGECYLDTQTQPREWPKGRGSKLLNQTLCVYHDTYDVRRLILVFVSTVFIFRSVRGVKYCDEHVCLSVCLSVCLVCLSVCLCLHL